MGSPAFAVPCLRALHAEHEVVLVVSQPDKPAGRGSQITSPAVAIAARELGLPVFQPKSARNGELLAALKASGAELAAVVAYGKILPRDVLDALPRGCLNVHGSLLPRWRGAAPIQWAVISGDAETGVDIMQLDEGMDTGPVLLEKRTPIGPDETSGELFERLAPMGAAALVEAIANIATLVPRAQQGEPMHARMLEKTDGAIDFTQPATQVAARIRGVDPWPGAVAQLAGQPLKLFRAREIDGHGAPGTVIAIDANGLQVACADGAVLIREIQAAGGKRMAPQQAAAGRKIAVGDVLS
jgi:methionyl-tRNA formyltransferase